MCPWTFHRHQPLKYVIMTSMQISQMISRKGQKWFALFAWSKIINITSQALNIFRCTILTLDLPSLLIYPITYLKKKVMDIFLSGKVIVGFKNIPKLQKTLPHFKNKSLRLYWDACGVLRPAHKPCYSQGLSLKSVGTFPLEYVNSGKLCSW